MTLESSIAASCVSQLAAPVALMHHVEQDLRIQRLAPVVAREAVVLKTTRPYQRGQEVFLNDPRPNGERLLVTGSLQEGNLSDFLVYEASLVPTDKIFTAKREVIRALNMQVCTCNCSSAV